MLPANAMNIFSLVFLLLIVAVVMPLCTLVFWHETKIFMIEVIEKLFGLELGHPRKVIMIIWAFLAVFTGLLGTFFLKKFQFSTDIC